MVVKPPHMGSIDTIIPADAGTEYGPRQEESALPDLKSPETVRMLAEAVDEMIIHKLNEVIPDEKHCPKHIRVDRFPNGSRGATTTITQLNALAARKGPDDLSWHGEVKYYASAFIDSQDKRERAFLKSNDVTLDLAHNIPGEETDTILIRMEKDRRTVSVYFKQEEDKWRVAVNTVDSSGKRTPILNPEEEFSYVSEVLTALNNAELPKEDLQGERDALMTLVASWGGTQGTPAPSNPS